MVATLTTVSREPGQALTGAAISGVALCKGCRHRTSVCFQPTGLEVPDHQNPDAPPSHG